MLRDRQHGPVIELNRISVKKSSQKAPPTANAAAGATPGTSAGPSGTGNGCKPVFQQMVVKMHLLGQEALLLPHRVWKVKFIGERYKNYRIYFDKKYQFHDFLFIFYVFFAWTFLSFLAHCDSAWYIPLQSNDRYEMLP